MTLGSIVNPKSGTAAGIALMLFGCFLFSLNDTLGKWLLSTYSVGQVMLVRSIVALLVLAPFIRRQHWDFTRMPKPGLQVLRVALSTCEVALFYWAVAYLPLADVVTFYLAGPIFVTALSIVMLGEHVGWRRWSAIVAGFIGVLIAMRPSTASFTLPALIALTGCFLFSLFMIVTRMVRGTSDLALITSQMIGGLIVGMIFAPVGWTEPSLRDFALLSLLGVVALFAHVCVNRSLKFVSASVAVPYQYTLILWAIVFGYFVFGDVPDAMLILGAAIIVAAGIYIFLRERRLKTGGETFPPPVT